MIRSRIRSFAGLLGLLLIFFILEASSASGLLDPRYFPRPSTALSRLFSLAINNEVTNSGTFYEHLLASCMRFAAGVSIASAVSFLLVMGSGISVTAKNMSSAVIGFLYPLPKSAVFPLLLLVFGINNGAHIALIVLGSVAMMLATSLAGLQRLEAAGYLELARAMKLNRRMTIRKVLIPGLLPEFMHSLKLGLSYGLVLLLVGEMIVTRQGVGVLLWAAWDQFNFVDLFAVFYLISLTGFMIFGLFDWLGEKFSASQRAV
jgi:ABC-type nitrate/sulfonate/bicarbonate transport system permease component